MPSCVVALVSFGKDSTKRLSRVLNRLSVDNRIVLPNETPTFEYTHIILSGGPKHVYEPNHYSMPQWVLDSKAPVLGVCYGMQLIAKTFGGTVTRMNIVEQGPIEVTEMIGGNQVINVRWMNRFDQVVNIPPKFTITGVTNRNHIASFTDYERWLAVQYHPEAKKHGDMSIFRRFLCLNNGNKCPVYLV
ncbi:Glutamine-hydrolyzing GMP synthase [uncultured virus]|nr:Glutamine-hydrolyzing GMP synthase [uncultured virus]